MEPGAAAISSVSTDALGRRIEYITSTPDPNSCMAMSRAACVSNVLYNESTQESKLGGGATTKAVLGTGAITCEGPGTAPELAEEEPGGPDIAALLDGPEPTRRPGSSGGPGGAGGGGAVGESAAACSGNLGRGAQCNE
eukprot:15468311-Alexandrium_andersonii.AAC.1